MVSLLASLKVREGLGRGMDPLSSYLFVIVMEVLTCILKEKSNKPDFRFHWRCSQPKIINLCFADDLMLFCKGDVSSVKHIQDSLHEFESLSGLSPSPGKSNVFFSGVQYSTREEILLMLGFKEGFLPVRYLGVPLLSTKLKHIDCKTMIDRITSKTKTWTNRDLTYAGRVQLIKNVLFSMQTYWSSLFILPKKVINEVETILRSFLWSGPDLKRTGAKVSWEQLCCPKQEGGLGFKSILVWNKAAIAKHIWFLISGGEQSMWCQWVKSYLLKGKSFWEVKMPSSPSWVWRKLLNLRPIVQPHIKIVIGNGKATSLWFDNWHPLGPLAHKFGPRVIYDLGLTKDATVDAIIRGSNWGLPITQTLEINEIRHAMSSIPKPNKDLEDQFRWELNSNGEFSISSLWNELRTQYPKVPWHSSIWFPGHIPKCSMITWLAIHNRLYTGDRLVLFGTIPVSCCSFCTGIESHDHLFFNCPLISQIWSRMQAHINVSWPPRSWGDWINHISTFKGKSLKNLIIKLIFTATIYQIWMERNNRKFQNASCTVPTVVAKIHMMVRYRLLSLDSLPHGQHCQDLLTKWGIT